MQRRTKAGRNHGFFCVKTYVYRKKRLASLRSKSEHTATGKTHKTNKNDVLI